ncbi:hypothetical protein G7Y89_g4082 [Cudoniella acicularis]|uniref:Uncharacterized protein n=1 Tax=Cudoniella acicularis TaxID=354080 RepID=A0A8H4RS31_9HELO|nr:hypothetical protein G7Y89_g4082 [Cudoniella acicularis]
MPPFFKSEFFNFEFLRVLHTAAFQGSDVGECMEAWAEIKDGDTESWYKAWQSAAAKSEALAVEAHSSGDLEGEKWCLFRTAHYLKSSDVFLHIDPTDDRIIPVCEKAIEVFQRGIKLLDSNVYQVEIPHEDYTLPGYLYMPTERSHMGKKIPIIINTGGFDLSREELYFFVSAGARIRGYASLDYDGPGQGMLLRKKGKQLRPDWEVVIANVLDFVYSFSSSHPELNLDVDRVALTGNSMGGYFVLRGASDPRVDACICIDGFYDLWLIIDSRFPGWFTRGWSAGWISDGFVNGVVNMICRYDVQMAWEIHQGMWVYGVPTPADFFREMKKYTLALPEGKSELAKVKCPVLVTTPGNTLYFKPEISTHLVLNELKHLGDQRSTWDAKGVGHGGLQGKVGALAISHQKYFAFLDEKFGFVRGKKNNAALEELA